MPSKQSAELIIVSWLAACLAGGTRLDEILVVGAAHPANGQMPLSAGEPVADRHEIFVLGTAPPAGRKVPPHRGPLLAVQRADHERCEVIAPSGAALSHLLPNSP